MFLLEVFKGVTLCNKIWERKWKVGPWNRFVQTQREVREE